MCCDWPIIQLKVSKSQDFWVLVRKMFKKKCQKSGKNRKKVPESGKFAVARANLINFDCQSDVKTNF
jgi:hypothetical protein